MRFGLILLAMVFAACAPIFAPVKDIYRVGSNYVDKELFEGEWYHQGTIVDKNYNQAGTFIGSQSDLDRVKFEITENLLIAYRSYERVTGTEGANPGRQTWVAVFAIEKHFDIRRRYNEHNSVEDNVVVENDTDRPWAERQYMRVDWSKNLVADAQFNDFVKTESIQTVARNALGQDKEPFRVRVSPTYIETTIEALAKPSDNVCSSIGEWNCAPSRVRVKYSFKKVDEGNQYEKMVYPDFLPLMYGQNAKKEICVKDDEGCTNLRELWLNHGSAGTEICDPKRHNIDDCEQYQIPVFSRFGYFRTERNHYDRESGFTASGREQFINRWNIWKETRRADGSAIPVKEREPKAIVYHLNATFPQDLYGESQRMADDWSTAFVAAVAAAKGVSSAEILNRYGKLFQIRLNDCNLPNIASYVKEHKLEAALHAEGLDQVEIGNIERACAFLEWYSEKKDISPLFEWQEIGDLRYSFLNYTTKSELSGPLGYGPSSSDPLTGEIIGANANIYGASIDVYAAWGADVVQLLNGQISKEDVMNGSHIRSQIFGSRKKLDEGVSESEVNAFGALFDQRIAGIPNDEYLKSIPKSSIGKNIGLLRNSGFEDQYLLSDEMTRLFASSDKARPSDWGFLGEPSESSFMEEFDRREKFFGERSACFFNETLEPAVAEFAASLQGKSWQEAFFSIREKVFRATATHELGHTVGLRHNFQGSADPMNYFPNFWDVDTGDERMSQATNRKSELQYSSIMDYHQRFNADFAGVGLYDRAAIKFGYTSLIEVFDESKSEFVPRGWFSNLDMFNYKDLPLLFSGDNVDDKMDKHYDQVRSRFRRGDESARVDVKSLGIRAHTENLFKRKNIPFTQYYRGLASRFFGTDSPVGEVYEVPYKYCSDAYAGGGSLTCNRWDMGATAEEIVDNAAQMYDGYYLFNAFRGDKHQISPSSYMARLYARSYQPMLNVFRYMYFYRRSSMRIWPVMQDWTTAAYKGLNFFAKILQTVEPGRYCLTNNTLYLPENEVSNCLEPIDIGMPEGKYLNTMWTDSYFFKAQNIGHMYDKILAMRALTDSSAFFTRDFSSTFNRGAFSIGYYRAFAPEMIQLFTAMMQENFYDYAPEVAMENGQAHVSYRPLVSGMPQTAGTSIRIKPSQSPIMRRYAIVLPMIHYSSSIDKQLDFAKRSRITVVGSRNDPTVDPTMPQIVFADPYTRRQYRSVSIEADKVSPGYLLLSDAQSFVSEATLGKPAGAWRAAKNAVDKAQSEGKQDELVQAQKDLRYYDAKLRDKVQLIETVKRLGDLIEFGS
jgi:hypothetical protein